MPGSEPETSSGPDFMGIDFGSFDSPAAAPSAPALSPGKPGRDYDEELKYALEYGPVVGVHILLQSSGPDKIYAEDAMRQKEMTMLFNDIIFLKMLQAEGMSIPWTTAKSRISVQIPAACAPLSITATEACARSCPSIFPNSKFNH